MRRALFLLALAGWACGGDDDPSTTTGDPPLDIPVGCNPIGTDADCLLPYPSDFYLKPGADTPSTKRVVLPEAGWIAADGVPVDMLAIHPPDGFSHAAPILVALGEAIDDADLVFHTGDLARSLTADSPTLLLDAATGEPVLHFAEVDPRAFDDARRALVIRPMVRLEHETRYVVALHGIRRPDGSTLPAGARFASLRDHAGAAHPALAAMSDHYEAEVFPVLESAGLARGDVQLAWDFSTQSEASVTGDMLAIRDDVMARLSSAPPEIALVEARDGQSSSVGRKIDLTVRVPLYVESAEPNAKLNRDADGNVVAKGEADVPVSVLIPPSVLARPPGTPPARLLQFGHGFFGTREEAEGFPSDLAEEKGFVIVASDWWGFSTADQDAVTSAILDDLGEVGRMGDRVHQAMANLMFVARAAQGAIASLPEVQVEGEPAYDPSAVYFYGISMGHILGGTYAALSPDIGRAALSVGGANLSMMMFRSAPFGAFLAIIGLVVEDPLEQQKLAVLLQSSLDRFDPMTYAPYVLASPLPGGPPVKRVLAHAGLGDVLVPNLASELHARALGLSLLTPSPRPVFGLEEVTGPFDGSALVEFDFHIDPLPSIEAIPTLEANEVHEGVRRLPASMDQVDRFLRPGGSIEQTCEGACDPE